MKRDALINKIADYIDDYRDQRNTYTGSLNALADFILARETAMLEEIEKPLKYVGFCSDCQGQGGIQRFLSNGELYQERCETCSGEGKCRTPKVDEALSIIQRRKVSHA